MPLFGVEQVVDEMTAVLRAGLTAKLAALAAAFGDGLALPAPAPGSYWIELEDPTAADFSLPAICVVSGNDDIEDQSLGDDVQTLHLVLVDVICQADSKTDLRKRLWRYTRAIKEVLLTSGAIATGTIKGRGTNWLQPEFTVTAGDLRRDAPTLFTIQTHELVD